MAAGRVIAPNEIFLNGQYYHVALLEEKESSVLPEKQVFGDWSRGSDPYKSQVVFTDWRGGIGQWYLDDPNKVNRAWWSECQLRWKGHLIPPFAVTDTDDLATPNTAAIAGLVASDVVTQGTYLMYAAFGDNIHVHSTADESWTSVQNIAGSQTVNDALHIELGGTGYLVYAHTAGYDYSSDGVAWTADVTYTQIKYLADWDDKLWLIDRDGKLYYSTTIGTEVADAVLRLPRNSVTNLFVGPDANGEPIIYAATTVGLYAHDFANARFVKTGLELPYNANNGLGSCAWRGKIYFSSNMAVYEYDPRMGTVRAIGLDSDDGLRARSRGIIKHLEGTLYELLALVDASGTTNGSSGIYGWDGLGWENKVADVGDNAYGADAMVVSSAVGSYRIWFGGKVTANTRIVRYQAIPADRLPPAQIGSLFGISTAQVRHYTPWFTAGQDNIDKIALRVTADINIPTASDNFYLYYLRDWGTTTTVIQENVTVGPAAGARVLAYNFPATGDAVGVAFRAISFYVVLQAALTGNLIDLRSLTLEYVPKLRLKRQWRAVVDLNAEVHGVSPKAQRDNLETVLGNALLVEFTYRDEAGFFVLAFQDKTTAFTGKDERGAMSLLLVEP